MHFTSTLATLLAGAAPLVAAVKPITVKGNYFINPANGNRFQFVGVAYQPGGSAGFKPESGIDPLSNGDVCLRDAAIMQVLGVNAIRVYNLDPDLNHDACASIFNAAGIYMIIDVNSPLVAQNLQSHNPWESYYAAYLNHTFAVVEGFKSYPNTAAFFSGNEVIFQDDSAETVPPYIRAVTRDLKNYIAKHSTRAIPVGYSAADVRNVLFDTWSYMQCSMDGTASDPSRSDLFALNSYSWCGQSNFNDSTYSDLVSGFQSSSVPVFFSEYGCNKVYPRFSEVPTIYGSQMTGVFSGGVVYEYAQEANNFGLVTINSDGSAQFKDDFYQLQAQYATLDFTTIQGSAPPSNSPSIVKCDSSLIKSTSFNSNFTLPVLPPGAQDILDKGVSPAPVGKIISISSYNVKAKVSDNKGNVITGLAVVPLANDAVDAPGSNTAASISGTAAATATSTSTATPAATSKNAASGMYTPSGEGWMVVAKIMGFTAACVLLESFC